VRGKDEGRTKGLHFANKGLFISSPSHRVSGHFLDDACHPWAPKVLGLAKSFLPLYKFAQSATGLACDKVGHAPTHYSLRRSMIDKR